MPLPARGYPPGMPTDDTDHGPDAALLGVYPPEHVGTVLEALRRHGVPRHAVRLGADADGVLELRAEMREETDEAWIAPQAGLAYSKEAAKGGSASTVLLAVLGAVLFAPFGAIPFGGLPTVARVVLMAIVGALALGAIGAIAGPALSVRRANDPLAAERGVTVRVDADTPELEAAMASSHPIRLDRIGPDGDRLATLATEEQERRDGLADDVAATARDMKEHLREPGSDLVSPDEPRPTPRDRPRGR